MFIISTKDNRIISTESGTNDNVEFWKVLDRELGREAAELFDCLIASAKKTDPDILRQLSININNLRVALAKKDFSKLEDIINNLDEIYKDLS